MAQGVLQLARDFSPRVETHGPGLVTLDIRGLGSLLGDARAIGEELRRARPNDTGRHALPARRSATRRERGSLEP